VNHIRQIGGVLTCTTLSACHPERSLAASKASGQTQLKDPYHHDAGSVTERNFRIAVRFFDEYEVEQLPVLSGAVAACQNPSRECRMTKERQIESRTGATYTENRHP
jgi:hypothetical protein